MRIPPALPPGDRGMPQRSATSARAGPRTFGGLHSRLTQGACGANMPTERAFTMRTTLTTATMTVAALAIGAGVAAAQTPKKGGELNFSVVAEPPNYDCHASTTFPLRTRTPPPYPPLANLNAHRYAQ